MFDVVIQTTALTNNCATYFSKIWMARPFFGKSLPVQIHQAQMAHDKMQSGAVLNGDNLRIYRVYMWISDYCRVTIMVMVRVMVRNVVRVRVSIRVSIRVGVAGCCTQTARKSDKMRINHVIKTDQW